jgi:hypothetical protein
LPRNSRSASAAIHRADRESCRAISSAAAILATANSDPGNEGAGRDEPILMVISYGTVRVIHTATGHDLAAMDYVRLHRHAPARQEWDARGKVTQKVPTDFPAARTSTRAGIIAGNRQIGGGLSGIGNSDV